MKCAHLLLSSLVVSLLAAQARAEYRVVLIEAHYVKGKVEVTIYSDEKKDRRSGAPLDEAVKAVEGMQGWGSAVGVYYCPDNTVPAEESKKLLKAIERNAWLGRIRSDDAVLSRLRCHCRKEGGGK